VLSGCSSAEQKFQKLLDTELSQEIVYVPYHNNGLSLEYPQWPASDGESDGKTEISVTKGYCSVVINTEQISAKQWYDLLLDSVKKQGFDVFEARNEEKYARYSTEFQNLTLITESRMYDCNGYATAVQVWCIEQVYNRTGNIRERVFSSVRCEQTAGSDKKTREKAIKEDNKPDVDVVEEEIIYNFFEEQDFFVQYPDWQKIEGGGAEKVIGVTAGVCSVFVNKYNARPADLVQWFEKTISEKEEHKILNAYTNDDKWYFDYSFPYEDKTLTAKTKMSYCNYLTYSTLVACVDDLMTGEEGEKYEEMSERVLDSAGCRKEYEIPTPKQIKEKRAEIEKEEMETFDELEEGIVRTTIGAEFGIDEELVVYFINNNVFFTKIMQDFPKANLVFEDTENNRILQLRVLVGDDGKISLLEDGRHDDADVTLILPLRDALNMFGNAQNINPFTLLGFAVNARTEPVEIKNEVIQRVLRGEYR
jgi:hypothetical protein